MRPGVKVTAVQRIVRLFFLVGVAIAAYLVLSFFDHAARADAGTIDQIGGTDPVASVKSVAADVKKVIPEPKPAARKAQPPVPRPHPQKIQTPKIQSAKVGAPKIRALRVSALRIQVPAVEVTTARVAADTAMREARARASKLGLQSSDAVRDAATTAASRTRAAVVQLASMTQVPDRPQPRFPGLPKAWTPAWTPPPRPAPQPSALPSGSVLHRPLTLPQTSGLSGVTTMPPAPPDPCALNLRAPELRGSSVESQRAGVAQPRTAPHPGPPPRQPVDRSTSTGQARDSGGGSSPATGTVSSSWRPYMAAAGRTLSTDLIARGRTARYAGPPS